MVAARIILACLAMMILAAGCTNDDIQEVDTPGEHIMQIYATRQPPEADEATRANYWWGWRGIHGGGQFSWAEGDAISVFIIDKNGDVIHSNLKFSIVPGSIEDGDSPTMNMDTEAIFAGTVPPSDTNIWYVYAVYPYSENCTYKNDNGKHLLDVHINPEIEGFIFPQGAVAPPLIAAGHSDVLEKKYKLQFQGASTIIDIGLEFEGPEEWSTRIRKITLRSNATTDPENIYICGNGVVDMFAVYQNRTNYSADYNHRTAAATFSGNGMKVEPIEKKGIYEAFIFAKEFAPDPEKGITLDIYTVDGWRVTRVFKPKTGTIFKRNYASGLPMLTIKYTDWYQSPEPDPDGNWITPPGGIIQPNGTWN